MVKRSRIAGRTVDQVLFPALFCLEGPVGIGEQRAAEADDIGFLLAEDFFRMHGLSDLAGRNDRSVESRLSDGIPYTLGKVDVSPIRPPEPRAHAMTAVAGHRIGRTAFRRRQRVFKAAACRVSVNPAVGVHISEQPDGTFPANASLLETP